MHCSRASCSGDNLEVLSLSSFIVGSLEDGARWLSVVLRMSCGSKLIVAESVWSIHEDQTWSSQQRWIWSEYSAQRWALLTMRVPAPVVVLTWYCGVRTSSKVAIKCQSWIEVSSAQIQMSNALLD